MTPREKLIALRDALRAPMPEGFEWDYTHGAGDAIALAQRLGLISCDINTSEVASFQAAFGISEEEVDRIFWNAEDEFSGRTWHEVTPADCATAIDRVLAEGE